MECYDELGNRYQLPVYVLTSPTNLIEEASEADTIPDDTSSAVPGLEILVKFHLSTGKDIKLPVRTTDSILSVKRKIQATENIEPSKQRMFFAGKQLVDKLRIEDTKILKGYTVQVVISQPVQISS
jgi:ubiquitin